MKIGGLFLTVFIWLGLGIVVAQAQGLSMAADDSFQQALEYNPSGTSTTWQNPDGDRSGTTLPLKTFQTESGIYCREFQRTIIIDGQEQQGYGTACRQPDGSWRIVAPEPLRQPAQQPVRVTRIHVYQPPDYAYPYYGYPYPYWGFPGYLSLSFGSVRYSGHSHSHRHYRPYWEGAHRHGRSHNGYSNHNWRGRRHHR